MVQPEQSAYIKAKKHSEDLYAKVVELCNGKKYSYSRADKELSISKSSVGNYMKKWKSGTPVAEIQPQGRKPKLNNKGRQRVRDVLKQDPKATSREIAHELSRTDTNLIRSL